MTNLTKRNACLRSFSKIDCDLNSFKEFLKGAEIAYESILTAFANGDLIKLKSLLATNMFSNFS